MIHPDRAFRTNWDLVVLVCTVIAAIEVPLRITLNYPMVGWLRVYDGVITAVFMVDVVLSFFTQYYEGKKLVTQRGEIARRYLRGWFLIDFLAAVPFDMLASTVAWSGANRFFRLLRLARLMRLARLAHFMRKWSRSGNVNPSVLRMVYLVFWIVLGAHFVACVWLMLGAGNSAGTFGEYPPGDHVRSYVRSLYWVTTTLTTIGYGDIAPVTNRQTVFCMFIQLLGAGMYGFVIGNIANLIANLDIAKAQFRERMEKITTFMRYKSIPSTTQEKVQDYYNYIWETRRGYDEFTIISEFPSPIKTEILMFLNRDMIEKVPIFKGASQDFVTEIVLNLRPVVFSPTDYVFKKGALGYNMYFISRGSVDVVSEDGKTVYATLKEGNFFGEIALLLSMPRTASIRAVDYCDLYELDKDTFDRVLKRYPEFERHLQELARKRQEEIQKESGKKPS